MQQPQTPKPMWKSRKFRALLVGLISMLAVHFGIHAIQPEIWAALIIALVGVYTGGVSLEDGLTRMAMALMTAFVDDPDDPDDTISTDDIVHAIDSIATSNATSVGSTSDSSKTDAG